MMCNQLHEDCIMVTRSQLLEFTPKANPALIDAVVKNWHVAEKAGVKTPKRIRQFLSNIAVETAGLTRVVENLNYTSAARLCQIWPRRFKTEKSARPYVNNPKKLAIKVYGGRLGNNPAPSTDGWDYRGGGMLQTTGRANYAALGFDKNPEKLREPKTAFITAVQEWSKRGCNQLADKQATVAIRKAIQGGSGGLSEVRRYLAKAEKIWPDTRFTEAITREPNPKPTSVQIEEAQQMLRDLGYTEVGKPDGLTGPLTRTAILAFRADNNLPLSVEVDTQLLNALKDACPRAMPTGRAAASREHVIKRIPEVKSHFLNKIVSALTASISGIAALFTGMLDNIKEARETLSPVEHYLTSVPVWVWLILICLVAVVMCVIARKGEKAGVNAFRHGERR